MGYAVGLLGMIEARGLYLSADRYFLILLVPALALGVTRRYLLDFLPFIALIILYEETRGLAHIISPHAYYRPQLDVDRFLFGGNVPTIWLQHHLWHGHLRWFDQVLAVLLRLHFIVPPTLLFLIWLQNRARYYRLAITMVGVSYAGALGFAVFPAAPPWLAAHHHLLPHITRIDNLPAQHLNTPTSFIYQHILRNEVAAVPSLHAAYATLVVLFCFNIRRWLGFAAAPYALAMWFGIVYFGEHYVSDALTGIALAIVGYALVGRLIGRTRLAGPFTSPLARARGAPPAGKRSRPLVPDRPSSPLD